MEREERRATLLAAIAVALGAGTFGYTVASAEDGAVGRAREIAPGRGPAPTAGEEAACGAAGCGGHTHTGDEQGEQTE